MLAASTGPIGPAEAAARGVFGAVCKPSAVLPRSFHANTQNLQFPLGGRLDACVMGPTARGGIQHAAATSGTAT